MTYGGPSSLNIQGPVLIQVQPLFVDPESPTPKTRKCLELESHKQCRLSASLYVCLVTYRNEKQTDQQISEKTRKTQSPEHMRKQKRLSFL